MRRMRIGVGCAAMLLAAVAAAGAQDTAKKKDKKSDDGDDKKPFAPSALFTGDSVLRVTIAADWKQIAKQRDTLNPKKFTGVVTVLGDDHLPKTMPVQLQTRGHFRLQRLNCDIPPLRVDFSESKPGGTPFKGQRALKLVTHCRNRPDDWEQYVVREWTAYRMQRAVGEPGFSARLARVRYVDAGDTTKGVERWGFFLESERELARRIGGKIMEAQGGGWMDIEPDSGTSFAVWQYMIGNNDWSVSYLHNVRFVATPAGTRGIPYDFDFSGFVNASYAGPPPGFPIQTVRQRLWRGPCVRPEQLEPVLARFHAQRPTIDGFLRDAPGLDDRYRSSTAKWMNEFWDDTREAKKFMGRVRASCDKW